jgi:hypothetical protein
MDFASIRMITDDLEPVVTLPSSSGWLRSL